MSYRPLEGLTVIELASVLAGPAIGMFFAELGARVIKVENRSRGGDMTRHWKLKNESSSSPISAYFSSVNYGKEYIDLNLEDEIDRAKLYELIATADIVINNMKPSSAKRLGVDPKELIKAHPGLIIASLHGFAGEGNQVAFDIVLQAETGFISMCGSEGQPAKIPVAVIDLIAAHQLKEAILLALLQKSKDGKGALIETNLEECSLSSLVNQASNYLMTGKVSKPMGTLHPNIAPYGEIITTEQGEQFVLAIGTDVQFQRLCTILELDLSNDSRFTSNKARLEHRQQLTELLIEAATTIDGEHFYSKCIEQKVPMGKIKTLDEVLSSDVAQSMVREEEIEGMPSKRLSSIAFTVKR